MKVLTHIGNYFKNLFRCIIWMIIDLLPYAFFWGTLALITYWLGGFNVVDRFTRPDAFILFGVVSLMSVVVSACYLGGVGGEIGPTFTFMLSDGKKYDVYVSDKDISITDHGSAGSGILLLNFLKCIIMAPLKLVKWLLLCPVFLLFGRDSDSMRPKYEDDAGTRAIIGLLCLIIAIILACPMAIADAVYKKKYNVDDIKFTNFNYYYENNYGVIWHTFEFTLYEPSAKLESLGGFLVIVCDENEYRIPGPSWNAQADGKVRFTLRADLDCPEMFLHELTPYLDNSDTVLYFDLTSATYKSVSWQYNEQIDGVSKHIPIRGDEKKAKNANQLDFRTIQAYVMCSFTHETHITWRSQTSHPKDTSRSAPAEHIIEKSTAEAVLFLAPPTGLEPVTP